MLKANYGQCVWSKLKKKIAFVAQVESADSVHKSSTSWDGLFCRAIAVTMAIVM